jgi:hypothetical protein
MASHSLPSTRRGFLIGTGAAAFVSALPLGAQERRDLLRARWNARWISAPGAPATEYGVYYFRRTVELAAVPANFVVHVTGDNRYQLFVNGRRASWGPARGDLFNWRYETVDIAPFLQPGKNVLAAVVWNFGEGGPQAQITLQTGFLMEGAGEAESGVATGTSWKCMRDEAYSPGTGGSVRGYYAVGLTDRVAGDKHPWGWESPGFDDSAWPNAVVISVAGGREGRDVPSRCPSAASPSGRTWGI